MHSPGTLARSQPRISGCVLVHDRVGARRPGRSVSLGLGKYRTPGRAHAGLSVEHCLRSIARGSAFSGLIPNVPCLRTRHDSVGKFQMTLDRGTLPDRDWLIAECRAFERSMALRSAIELDLFTKIGSGRSTAQS